MVTFICDQCRRPLEVDDELAGQDVACPHCAAINIPPAPPERSPTPPGVPVARAAHQHPSHPPHQPHRRVHPPIGPNRSLDQRLAQLELPPASGEEQTIEVIHPAMFRARPDLGLILVALFAGGLLGAGLLAHRSAGTVALAPLALTLAAIGWWIAWKIRTLGTSLILTSKRAVFRRGILSKQTTECVYDRIQDIEIHQSFWERILKVGRIELDTSAESGVEISIADIPDPTRIRRIIDAYRGL